MGNTIKNINLICLFLYFFNANRNISNRRLLEILKKNNNSWIIQKFGIYKK